jgi:predicted nucleotidyltransferase
MNLADVIAVLKAAEPAPRPHGILLAAVFGSTARGEPGPNSDIDIAVELDDAIIRTVYDYVGARFAVSDLFDEPVDVVNRAQLKPWVRDNVERDLVHAF